MLFRKVWAREVATCRGSGKVFAAAHSHTCVQVHRVAAACQAYPHQGAVQGRAGNESCLTSSCALQPCIGARSCTKGTQPAQAGARDCAGASSSRPAEGEALQKVCACYLQRPAPLQAWPGTSCMKPLDRSIIAAWRRCLHSRASSADVPEVSRPSPSKEEARRLLLYVLDCWRCPDAERQRLK